MKVFSEPRGTDARVQVGDGKGDDIAPEEVGGWRATSGQDSELKERYMREYDEIGQALCTIDNELAALSGGRRRGLLMKGPCADGRDSPGYLCFAYNHGRAIRYRLKHAFQRSAVMSSRPTHAKSAGSDSGARQRKEKNGWRSRSLVETGRGRGFLKRQGIPEGIP
jgi:hypothetical protein